MYKTLLSLINPGRNLARSVEWMYEVLALQNQTSSVDPFYILSMLKKERKKCFI